MFSWYKTLALHGLKFVDGKLSLNDYHGKTYCISTLLYYCFDVPSCYKTLAIPSLRFVNRKLSLTIMVRLNVFQRCVYYHYGVSSYYETLVVNGFI